MRTREYDIKRYGSIEAADAFDWSENWIDIYIGRPIEKIKETLGKIGQYFKVIR